MSVLLFNPTNEELRGMYQGEELVLPPYPEKGHKVKVDEKRGNHILNQLQARGLKKLEYGDQDREAAIAEDGRRINMRFKQKQVEDFNGQNAMKRIQNIPTSEPPPHIVQYAEETGVEIERPYKSTTAESQRLAELTAERDEKDKRIAKLEEDLAGAVALLREAAGMKSAEEAEAEKLQLSAESIKNIYKLKRKPDFKEWAMGSEGYNIYHTSPVEVQEDMRAKWASFYDEAFPY